jgi:hypothetical protein
MAHYAFLDENNIVTEVIVGKDETDTSENWELWYSAFRQQPCKRTSFNTRGGIYYMAGTDIPSSDQSKAFRKNYAGIGYKYDANLDGFIPPQIFPSWSLNTDTGLWDPPTPMPTDGKLYYWDETTQSWVSVDVSVT